MKSDKTQCNPKIVEHLAYNVRPCHYLISDFAKCKRSGITTSRILLAAQAASTSAGCPSFSIPKVKLKWKPKVCTRLHESNQDPGPTQFWNNSWEMQYKSLAKFFFWALALEEGRGISGSCLFALDPERARFWRVVIPVHDFMQTYQARRW